MKKISEVEDIPQPLVRSSRRIIKSLKAKADSKRTWPQKIADWMTLNLGSIGFLAANVVWFTSWIVVNSGLIPGIEPFDPFPFGLLTMIVSLEAIMLAIFVLISQNRSQQIDDLREEIDLQVDIITEEEITKLLQMVSALMEKNGIDISKDKVLDSMIRPMNVHKLEKALEKQVMENNNTKS
jgi:uncharacterized membrane protein